MTKWVEHGNGICWEESTLLADAGLRHGVTGKSGGVSEAPFTSLNLGLHVGDQPKAVLENRRRLCALLGYPLQKLTTAQQTHEDHVVAVGPAEIGSGAGSYADALAHTDAIMTNLPGVPLMLCIADCVPVIVYDPVKRAVAVIHDGWRGTVQRLAAKTVFAMRLAYGSAPKDLLAYVGPSISRAHYEVSESTAMAFAWGRPMGNAPASAMASGPSIYGRPTGCSWKKRASGRTTSKLRRAAFLLKKGSSFPIAATAVIQDVWGPLPSFEKQMGQIFKYD